jgi:hypothetical protein
MARNHQQLSNVVENEQVISSPASIINFRIDVNALFDEAMADLMPTDFATGQT